MVDWMCMEPFLGATELRFLVATHRMQPTTVRDVAETIGRSYGNMSVVNSRLRNMGLTEFRWSPGPGRGRLCLTGSWEEVMGRMRGVVEKYLEGALRAIDELEHADITGADLDSKAAPSPTEGRLNRRILRSGVV